MDYSGSVSSGVRIAQVVGITTSAWLSGSISTFSWAGVQSVLSAKTPSVEAAKVWHELYTIGASSMPFVAVVPAACFGYLAYDAATASSLRLGSFSTTAIYLYSFAALIIPGIAPFTFTAMKPTNDTLHGKALGKAPVGDDEEVRQLLVKWYGLNVTRAVMVGAGCLAGAYAAFGGI